MLHFKEFEIRHEVGHRLRNSYLQIDEYGEILLKTPPLSKERVYEILHKKEAWLRSRLSQMQLRPRPRIPHEVELFGTIRRTSDCCLGTMLKRLKVASTKNIQKCYDTFYKKEAQRYITPRLRVFEERMSLQCKGVRFRKMKRRWGSCSKEGVITFNTLLMKKEKDFIDEVIVHELAHLVHFNHSKEFHRLVERYL